MMISTCKLELNSLNCSYKIKIAFKIFRTRTQVVGMNEYVW
jgi:hypothetical protein